MKPTESDGDPAERAAREATGWFVRLNNPLATDDDRRAFRAWLDADPAHAEAIGQTRDLWDRLEAPANRLGASGWHREIAPPRRRKRRASAIAAALLAAGFACLAIWRDVGLIDRAFADHATRPGERLDVVLSDGTRLFLDGDSALDASFAPAARDVTLLRGRAWFDVTPDAARPFIVHAGAIEARAVGAGFAVDRAGGSVIVDQGSALVTAKVGRPVSLAANQRAALAADGALEPPSAVNPDVALAWRRGLIVLDAAPLADVATELARLEPGRLLIPDPKLAALRLSGVFRADDPDAIVEAMRAGLGLKTVSLPGVATVIYR
ncbi:FecR family protein [Methylopila turkensis]|uniref:Sensor n=1 Tax=Methylopila turkensis TaxID=1437816 RepID=A0A9W6JNG6_9HYPH|nr:FecR domain-containing protein [Methylopila turkensis]GLK80332.1 sensor [Methylopila turkensis]